MDWNTSLLFYRMTFVNDPVLPPQSGFSSTVAQSHQEPKMRVRSEGQSFPLTPVQAVSGIPKERVHPHFCSDKFGQITFKNYLLDFFLIT